MSSYTSVIYKFSAVSLDAKKEWLARSLAESRHEIVQILLDRSVCLGLCLLQVSILKQLPSPPDLILLLEQFGAYRRSVWQLYTFTNSGSSICKPFHFTEGSPRLLMILLAGPHHSYRTTAVCLNGWNFTIQASWLIWRIERSGS